MSRHSRPAALALVVLLAAGGCGGRRPEPSLVPEQDVEMDARVLARFYEEVQEYVRVRQEASKMVPPIQAGASAAEIGAHQKAIAEVIHRLRKGARRGDIFKPDVERAFRHVLERELHGPEGPAILEEVRAGNPRLEGVPKPSNPSQEVKEPFPLKVNGYYPDEAPFSSVPPSLLLKVPQLPEQVRYRFVGRALILRDTDANVILDFIPEVLKDKSIPR